MTSGKKYLEKSKSLAEGITLEFDSDGNEQLNPIQALTKKLSAARDTIIQCIEEPYRTLLSNFKYDSENTAVERLWRYATDYCFLSLQPGDYAGIPLEMPLSVCEAVYGDPGPDSSYEISYLQCPSCRYAPPERQTVRRGKVERVRLFEKCPLCGSDLQ